MGKKSKLAPRYTGPYTINRKVNLVAFELQLPIELSRLHNVFYVSQLKTFHQEVENESNTTIVTV